ncbi:MAG: CRTAC1 family protein, partial [Planctomycetes bacterium]|nr:CRTAC1 family protein [Planctomycetota bacterium]
MATSPAEAEASEEYANGWRLLQDHLRSGQSWSGMERHCVFLNVGDANFADASAVSGLDFFDDGRGMAVVDWDHDGDLDLWFSNRTGPRARLLRNDSSSGNGFVSFRLRSESNNPDAIGAEVELFFDGADEERHVRTLRAGSGFISQSSKWVHFGVPEGRMISHALVRWPAGKVTEHRGLRGGGRWTLRDTDTEPLAWDLPREDIALSEGGISAAPPKTTARIPIIQPLPLLGLTSETEDGRKVPLLREGDNGVLLTLWAD